MRMSEKLSVSGDAHCPKHRAVDKGHGSVRGSMRAMRDPGMLNACVELYVRAHAFLSPFFPQRGLLMLGGSGVEFRQRGGRGYIQVPWGSISVVRADAYGNFVRSVEICLDDGRTFSFVVDDGAEVVRTMSRYLRREQLVPAKKPLSSLFERGFRKS
ncbi:hypothetical protein B5F33_01595 [Collinsella sp. An2]|nr:hypothetical protein B5F33_01595 [Collinsella sp. An2]